jgi:hypothetical protein
MAADDESDWVLTSERYMQQAMLFYVKAKFDPTGYDDPAAHQLFVAPVAVK